MYTPINCWKLCQKGKNLYDDIEKMEKRYNVKQIGVTKEQFEMLSAGIWEGSKLLYLKEIPIGKLIVKKLGD